MYDNGSLSLDILHIISCKEGTLHLEGPKVREARYRGWSRTTYSTIDSLWGKIRIPCRHSWAYIFKMGPINTDGIIHLPLWGTIFGGALLWWRGWSEVDILDAFIKDIFSSCLQDVTPYIHSKCRIYYFYVFQKMITVSLVQETRLNVKNMLSWDSYTIQPNNFYKSYNWLYFFVLSSFLWIHVYYMFDLC